MADGGVDRASPAQINYIKKLGYEGRMPYGKDDASRLISELKLREAAGRLRDRVKYEPGEAELRRLEKIVGMYAQAVIKCVDMGMTEPAAVGMVAKLWISGAGAD